MSAREKKQGKGKPAKPSEEKPEIYAVTRNAESLSFSRRSFLGVTATGAGALAMSAASSAHGAATKKGKEFGYAHGKGVSSLALSTDGRLLASADAGGTVKLWQMPEGILLKSWKGHTGGVTGLTFLPGTDELLFLLSTDSRGDVRLWTLPEGDRADGFALRGNRGTMLLAPRNTDLLLTYGKDKGIACWKRDDGAALSILEGHTQTVNTMAATPDGAILLSGSDDQTVRMWSLDSRSAIKTVKQFGRGVEALALVTDGSLAVAALSDGSIHKWSMPEPGDVQALKHVATKPIVAAVRPQKDWAAVGREKPEIALVPLSPLNKEMEYLKGHGGKVTCLAITPDGNFLVSGSEDKTIRIWDLAERKCTKHLIDLKASYKSSEGVQYKGKDVYGRTITYTLPCGAPIPPGAVCICNCVPGSLTIPKNYSRKFGTTGICTCDTICTCNTICTCQSVRTYGGHYWYPC